MSSLKHKQEVCLHLRN